MPKFNLADHLAAVAPVSNSDTSPVIKMLPTRKIFPNENNFYDTSNIDELVNSILMYGVLDPITVKPSGDGETYVIISGHRRHRAVTEILDSGLAEDATKFQAMPCIIREPKDELLEELMLIQANSATRVLTSAEISKQVERVERLLYELKEQGYEFPGRMRDNVAQACNVSASKIARLKVIREKLIPAYEKYYDKSELAESTAYALARLPAALQQELFDYRSNAYKGDAEKAANYLQVWKVEEFKKANDDIAKLTCTNGTCDKCTNRDGKLAKLFGVDYSYKSCATICCSACADLTICKRACPLLADKIAELKAEKKAARKEEKAAAAEENSAAVEQVKSIWRHFGEARKHANKSAADAFKSAGKYYTSGLYSEDYENGSAKYTAAMPLPLPISRVDVERLVRLADEFDCTVDYLLCRTEKLAPTAEAIPTWRTGEPPEDGKYIARFAFADGDDYKFVRLVEWRSSSRKFYFTVSGADISYKCTGWYPVPQDEEAE